MSRFFPLERSLVAGLCALVIAAQPLSAQEPGDPGQRGQAAVHAVVNFAELARREAAQPPVHRELVVIPFMPVPGPPAVGSQEARPSKETVPPTAELSLPSAQVPSPSPAASFAALGDDNTKIPPDTSGAVGPNHLMVMLNSQVRIQNRSGVPEVPGCPACDVSLESFWSATGATGVFYPRVVYDPFNDRWIVAAVSDRASANSSVLIGSSRTGDPTGLWDLYRVDTNDADTIPNANWADYPMLGFNALWVVVTVNRYTNSDNSFVNSFIYAFDKGDLYNGGAVPGYKFFIDTSTRGGPFPALTYDNAQPVMYLARVWENNYTDPDTGMTIGSLRISRITGTAGSPSYNPSPPIADVITPNPWAFAPPSGNDFASQLGTAQKIQNGDSRLLSLVYRNGSLWAAHNAFLPAGTPTRTAAQWWQFSTGGVLQQFGRVENSSGPVFYAYPSIAVNSQNDAMLGFSIFSGSQYAAAGYAARNALDTPGTMRDPVTLKAGEASYFKVAAPDPRNRWGDYSATQVDPANDADFWTIQEYASTPVSGSDRWGTWWGKVNAPPPLGTIAWENRRATDNTLQGGGTFTVGGASGPFACLGTSTNPITVVDNGTNDADPDAGQIQVNDVCLGSYTITETVVPAGWALDADTTRAITVSLVDLNAVVGTQGVNDAGTTEESDFHNHLGSLAWESRKVTDNTLQGGATFTVTPNPLTGSGTLTIVDGDGNDADTDPGQIQINNVLLASYTITETVAPAGWALDADTTRAITVSLVDLNAVVGTQGVNDAGTTEESDFHNRLGSLAWESRKVTDNTLQGGATFTVSPNPLTGSGTLTIVDNDSNDAAVTAGQIQINNVLLGIYTITETIAPPGWSPDSDTTRAQTVDVANLAAVVGTQGVDDPGITEESDFHNRLSRRGQLVSE